MLIEWKLGLLKAPKVELRQYSFFLICSLYGLRKTVLKALSTEGLNLWFCYLSVCMCVCVHVCTSKPVVPTGQQKNKNKNSNKNKKTKTKTTTTKANTKKKTKKQQKKQRQNQKNNKEKTANNNQKVRKHHIFRRHQVMFLTLVFSRTFFSFQKHTVGLFFHFRNTLSDFFTQQVSKMRKSEKRNIDICETVSKQKAFKRRLTRWHRRGRPNDTPSRTPHTKNYPKIYLTSPHYGGTDWHTHVR